MKCDHSLCALAAACVVTTSLNAAEDFEAATYTSAGSTSLNYRLHTPESMDADKQYPLILFLHGAGERGDDNTRQMVHGVKDILAYSVKSDTPVIILAPQCPKGQQWVNAPWGGAAHTMPEAPSAPMRLASELLDKVISTYPVDQKRVYVTGISMGGFGTWDIIQRMPYRFAAAIPICGGGDTNMAEVIKDIPLWVFHGGNDTTVKTQRSRDMIAAIKQAGGNPSYTEYEGVGHNSWTCTYQDEKVLEWLFSQKRK